MGVGSPHRLIDALVEAGAKGLTVIANDTATPGDGIGKLISRRQVCAGRSPRTSVSTPRRRRR